MEMQFTNAVNSPLAQVKTVEDIIRVAVALNKPLEVVNEWSGEKYTMSPIIGSSEFEKTYYYQNGVVSFQYDFIRYEVPATDDVIRILDENGFKSKLIWVQLCNNTIPLKYANHWKEMQNDRYAIATYKEMKEDEASYEKFQERCVEKGIKPLPPELLKKCFRVPDTGINIKHERGAWVSSKTIKPMSIKEKVDQSMEGKISEHIHGGGYSGQRTFVYIDGHSYVTASDDVVGFLIQNGYKEDDKVSHLGVGWFESIEDSYYDDAFRKTVVSDEAYMERRDVQQNDNLDIRELKVLREEVTRLKEENERLKEAEEKGNEESGPKLK